MTEDEMVGWHHQLNGHEFEQTLGDGEGQGGLAQTPAPSEAPASRPHWSPGKGLALGKIRAQPSRRRSRHSGDSSVASQARVSSPFSMWRP